MTLPTRALILAAGRGSRIAARSQGVPKPLLSVNGDPAGPSFLDWHLARLHEAGVNEVVIVGNRDTFKATLQVPIGLSVGWVLNPTRDLSRSGSGHSAHLAYQHRPDLLDGSAHLLLMDADILYGRELLPHVLASQKSHSRVVVQPSMVNTGEEVHVFASPETPHLARRQGKGLVETPMVRSLKRLGEATGMIVFHPDDQNDLLAASRWVMERSTAKLRSEHEDTTNQLMAMDRIHLHLLPEGTPFTECDTADDYAYMTEVVYPLVAH